MASGIQAQAFSLPAERLNTADGLLSNHVNHLLQDRRGYLWIATDEGANRFDGYTLVSLRTGVEMGSPAPIGGVEILVEDLSGRVWLGGTNGVARYKASGGETKTLLLQPDVAAPTALLAGIDERVWVARLGVIYQLDEAADSLRPVRNSVPAMPLSSEPLETELSQDPDGVVWATFRSAGELRLERFDESLSEFVSVHQEGISGGGPTRLKATGSGDIWFWSGRTLKRFDKGDGHIREIELPPESRSAGWSPSTSFSEDREGNLYFGTRGHGAYQINQTTGSVFGLLVDGIHDRAEITDLLHVKNGGLWIGTRSSGVFFLNARRELETRSLRNSDDLIGSVAPAVVDLLEDREGSLWFATTGGVSRVDQAATSTRRVLLDPGGTWSRSRIAVRALAEDKDGNVWLSTVGGVHKLDPSSGAVTRFPTPAGSQHEFGSILVKPDGDLLLTRTAFVAASAGLWSFSPKSGRYEILLENEAVHEAILDGAGTLWTATRDAVHRHGVTTTPSRVWNAVEDPDEPELFGPQLTLDRATNRPWLSAAGLFRFEPSVQEFKEIRVWGAAAGAIRASWSLADGLWSVWTDGPEVSRMNPQTGQFRRYWLDPDHALTSRDEIRSIFQDASGQVWLGGLSRLYMFDEGRDSFEVVGRVGWAGASQGITVLGQDAIGNLLLQSSRGFWGLDVSSGDIHSLWRRTEGPIVDAGGTGLVLSDGTLVGTMRGGVVLRDSGPLPRHVEPILSLEEVEVMTISGGGTGVKFWPEIGDTVELSHQENHLSISFVAIHFENPAANHYQFRLLPEEQEWRDAGTERLASYSNLDPGSYTFQVIASNAQGIWSTPASSLHLVVRPPWWATGVARAFWAVLIGLCVALGYRAQVARTDRRLKAEAAEQRIKDLHELDKMKTRFFANVAHEFRTPLTLTIGPLEDLARADIPDNMREDLNLALRGAHGMLRLTNQLLDAARLDAGHTRLDLQPVDLVRLVREAVLAFRPLVERDGFDFEASVPDHSVVALLDVQQFEKVLANLLSNAFKYTPPGGVIRVHLGANNARISLSVVNSGPGMTQEEIEHAFDRYFRSDRSELRSTPGSGIGLALVKEIVDLHRGEIRLESEPGIATRFTVTLDQVSGPPVNMASKPESGPPGSLGEPDEAFGSPKEVL